MCVVDWELVASVIAAVGSVGTLIVAWIALGTWKEQLRGTSRRRAAEDVASAARGLRYGFYDARNPFIGAWEFPEDYWRADHEGRDRTKAEEARGYMHVFRERRKLLWPHVKGLADLRPKAGAVLGDDVAGACEKLAQKANKLEFYHSEYVSQLRAGEQVVAAWADQNMVQKVKDAIYRALDHDDEYSQEFEADFSALIALLQPDLK